jgi:hypothetical protein
MLSGLTWIGQVRLPFYVFIYLYIQRQLKCEVQNELKINKDMTKPSQYPVSDSFMMQHKISKDLIKPTMFRKQRR